MELHTITDPTAKAALQGFHELQNFRTEMRRLKWQRITLEAAFALAIIPKGEAEHVEFNRHLDQHGPQKDTETGT